MKKRQKEQTAVPARASSAKLNMDAVAAGCIFIAAVVFYWPVISLQGTLWNDYIEQYYPYRVFASRALRNLTFPFWNPYSFSGMPFFADIQSAVLYPLNLLLALFSGKKMLNPVLFEYQIILHIILAGIFTYILARDFRRSRTGALTASLVYMLGGFATSHIFHVTMIHVLPWFALALFTFRRALLRSSLYYTAATGTILCFIAFAGHPQLYIYIHYLLAGYLLFHLITLFKEKMPIKKIAFSGAILLIAVCIGGGLSSVQLLPTSELSKESVRPEMEYRHSAQGSFRPHRFITLLAPNFYSMPNLYRDNVPPVYWGVSEDDIDPGAHYYWETTIYLGIAPLLLAILALLLRSPSVFFLGITAAVSFLIAMGDTTPFYWLVYHLLPGFKLFRNPARIGIIFTLAMSLLAAFGTDWLISNAAGLSQKAKRKTTGVFIAIAGAIFLLALLFAGGAFKQQVFTFLVKCGLLGDDIAQIEEYLFTSVYPFANAQVWLCTFLVFASLAIAAGRIHGFLPSRVVSVILPVFILADLLLFGYGFSAMKNNPRTIYETTPLIRSVQDEGKKEIFRINSRGSMPGSDEIGGPFLLFRRNEGTVHEMFLMEGYNPLRLKRQLMDRKTRTLDILNIKYKITWDELTGDMQIAPHATGLPRARMVPSYRVVTGEEQILPTLHDPVFDHVNEVVLEEQPEGVPAGQPPSDVSSAYITSYGYNRIETAVTNGRPALLVLSEIWYPAWKATVDGEPAKVLRADNALRAIPVPAGNHTVVCRYDDGAFKTGLAISLVTLLGTAVLLLYPVVKKRMAGASSAPVS